MKAALLSLLVLTASVTLAAVPSRNEAMTAIATLEGDLLSDDARDAARIITEYARDSEDVVFTLSPTTVPWLVEKRDRDEKEELVYSQLFAVYLAGNAKAQLLANKTEDDPYSGWVAALRAYKKVKAKEKIVIPSLEELAEMQKDGTLKAHARQVRENADRGPDEKPGARDTI